MRVVLPARPLQTGPMMGRLDRGRPRCNLTATGARRPAETEHRERVELPGRIAETEGTGHRVLL